MSEPEAPRRRGPKPGARSIVNRAAMQAAAATGRMPHEILLDIARGTPLIQSTMVWDGETQAFKAGPPQVLIPDLQMRMRAASDAAPYYAPKLSALELLQGMSDDELDAAIADLAAQAGLGVAAAGAGAASKEPAPGAGRDAASADRPVGDQLGHDGGAPAP